MKHRITIHFNSHDTAERFQHVLKSLTDGRCGLRCIAISLRNLARLATHITNKPDTDHEQANP